MVSPRTLGAIHISLAHVGGHPHFLGTGEWVAPSNPDFPETAARVGQSCRKLSMSGSCGWSLAIRCEEQARVPPQAERRRAVCVR